MALISTIPQSINDLATILAESLSSGQGARKQLGESDGAFSWAGGMPPTLSDYVAVASVSGLSFDVIIAKASGTPAGPVGEGQPKPDAIAFDTQTVTLVKYAGTATFTLEQALRAEALASVVYAVLAGQVLTAWESAAIAAVYSGAAAAASGDDLPGAILAGQAEVLGNGGRPGLLIVSPADYATLMVGSVGGYAGPGRDPAAGVGELFGMVMHVSAAATDGIPVVADPAAITAAQNEHSPTAVLDPFSGSSNNRIKVVLDLLAAAVVTSPGAVCECTVA